MARGSGTAGGRGGGGRGGFGRGGDGGRSSGGRGEGGGNTYHFDVTRAMSEVAKLKKPVENKKLVEKKPD